MTVSVLLQEKANSSTTDGSSSGAEAASQSPRMVSPPRPVADRIQVAVRLRPLTAADAKKQETTPSRSRRGAASKKEASTVVEDPALLPRAWQVESTDSDEQVLVQKGISRRVPGRNLFCFDAVLDEPTRTVNAYWRMARPVVQAVSSGRHGTIFCYGPTGSGKTYTMQGDPAQIGKSIGMIHMAAADLLESTDDEEHRDRTVRIQYFEVYNEQIRDLLALVQDHSKKQVVDRSPSSLSLSSKSNGSGHNHNSTTQGVTLREDTNGNVQVNARQQVVSCVQDIAYWLRRARPFRSSGTTSLNAHSSRSHAIFRISVSSRPKNDDSGVVIRESTLNLVDLAGSENSSNAGASGLRKRETGKINQSLLALSRVIHSLSLPEKKRPKHIGYRDSKLTRILQPHLSGNACMAIVCCVAPGKRQLEVTRSALKFADSAKRIRLEPKVNETVDLNAIIQALKRELQESREEVERLQAQLFKGGGAPISEVSSLAESSASSDSEDDQDGGMVVGITGTFGPTNASGEMASLAFKESQHGRESWSGQIQRSFTDSTSGEGGPLDEVMVVQQQQSVLSCGRMIATRTSLPLEYSDSEDEDDEVHFSEMAREQQEASNAKSSSPLGMSVVRQNFFSLGGDVEILGQQRLMLQVALGVALLGHFTSSTELFMAAMLFLWLSVSSTPEAETEVA